MATSETILEWFGATTFRLRTHGITIFLDTWLDRPSTLKEYLAVDDVTECDYIFISHAHFDHLPGADRIAKRTGAIIVGNGEVITVMRAAGIPEAQLMAVSGGERIPLFTLAQRQSVMNLDNSPSSPRPGPPGPSQGGGPPGPARPNASDAQFWVHAWPSLHALMPSGDHRSFPETIDTGTVYTGAALDACTMDVTRGLQYGLGAILNMPSLPPQIPAAMRPFLEYMRDRETNRYSYFDGGQIMFNFLLGTNKTLLWSAHLGGYEGLLKNLDPKPDIAILAIAGRANHNGRPFDGSSAQYAKMKVGWLGMPKKVIWCLHDEGALNPKFTDTRAATNTIDNETESKVWNLEPAKAYTLFD